MADVTLTLKADNTQYIQKVKEAQAANQKLHDQAVAGSQREKGILEEIEERLDSLSKARKKAFTYEEIEKYNKKIQETKQNLEEYEKAGLKVEKSGNSMMASIGKWALGFVSVATAIKLVKDAFAATEAGLRTFNTIGAVTKQIMYDLVKTQKIDLGNIILSIQANKELEKIRIEQRKEIVEIAKAQRSYNELYFKASDRTLTDTARLEALNTAMAQHNVLIDRKIAFAKEELNAIETGLAARYDDTKLLDAHAAKLAEIEDLESQRFSETKRLEMQRTSLIQEGNEKEIKSEKETVDEEMKLAKEIDDYYKELDADYFDRLDEREKARRDEFEDIVDIYRKRVHQENEARKEAKKLRDQEDEDKKESEEKVYEAKRQMLGEFTNLVGTLYDRQFSKLEAQYNRDIKAAGDNALLKASIEEKYLQKKNELSRRAARADKIFALFSIALDTAKGVMNAASKIVTLPLIPFIYALGAIQAAAVLARPTPTFAKGGWTGKGRERDETGERRAGIVHEEEFVIRRGPAHRFREVLEAINRDDKMAVYNSFNRLSPQLLGGTTNISVENSGPNKRLDSINNQLTELNRTLRPKGREEIISVGGQTIIRKGNNTKIVR